ncbi:MAG: bifunctional glutamate N-acetyltransferase/amino-acid acetyltransferase ArgJ [Planctomycetota bacterium]
MDTTICLRVAGFCTACTTAGIKRSSSAFGDMGLIVADRPAVAAGVFTQSRAAAAPVLVSRRHLAAGRPIGAILVNSGNANACTGAEGAANALALGADLARRLKLAPAQVLHASTGVIGHQLPVALMRKGLPVLVKGLAASNGFGLARTIMTTDLVPKWTCVEGYLDGRKITISGIAKGSGMIAPNMATMLSFVLTDAAVERKCLQRMWALVTADTFNRVTVDTDTSTNDSAFILAGGAAGNKRITDPTSAAGRHFMALLHQAVNPLARAIAIDGEGATKIITVTAAGFGSDAACDRVARTVAESPLVKTAMYGNDPNWGRIIAAAGRAGVPFPLSSISINLCRVPVFSKGAPAAFDRPALAARLKSSEVGIDLACGRGRGRARVYTCDYSYDYIKINADYHT